MRLPLESTGTYNFAVDWDNDGTADQTITSWDQATVTYATPGIHTITISFPNRSSTLRGWRFNNGGDRLKILNISQWGGKVNLGNNGNYFYGAENLRSNAADAPDLTGTTDLSGMFADAKLFNGNIGGWNTSGVTNMSHMFRGASAFNQPIGNWNTASVTDMAYMFGGASAFNQRIGDWDTSQVTDMAYMFVAASAFNQPIGDWDTSQVTNMAYTFYLASAFNQAIGNWDVGKVTNMSCMFNGALRSTSPLVLGTPPGHQHAFDVHSWATGFNQPIGDWNTSQVTNMSGMFFGASAFNQPIGGWKTSHVTTMS